MLKNFLFVISFFVLGTTFGQNFHKKVLFTINDDPVYASEFINVYNKNINLIEDENRNIDEYLQMFINYKLKVQEALDLNLDENAAFKNEFESYKKQLTQNFLTDSEVTEALIQEAYARTIEEVNAAHILLLLDENAAPEDTLRVYNKITDLREQILNGGDFSSLAKEYSEDPSAKQNAGALGWFKAFEMIYPFENAAYTTKIGAISEPVRTQHGYHLIKVNNRRKSAGEVSVAHIMLVDTVGKVPQAEEKIQLLYNELKNGANFEDLAKKHSADQVTAARGGKLNRFGAGKLTSEIFEQKAFQLNTPGEISEPFKTEFGWHVIKLLKKYPVPPYQEMKKELELKVKRDSRSKVVTQTMLERLKKKYKLGNTKKSLAFFQEYITNDVLKGKWKPKNEEHLLEKEFIAIKDSSATYLDFANYVKQKQDRIKANASKEMLVKKWHQDFINDFVLAYHKNHLDEESEQFAALAKEYKEGLLLFELMEEKIWKKAKEDTLGLEQFYFNNKDQYSGGNFEAVKGFVINDYQKHLEEQWLDVLRETSAVKIKKRIYRKIKRSLEQE